MAETSGGYRETFRDPVASRLFLALTITVIGDYVGQGALLILAFERSGGRLLGPAALFAIQAVPALLSGGLAGGWIDQIPRRTALVSLQVAGAAVIVLPLLAPGLAPVLAAAGLLGAVRVAYISARSGAIAEAVPEEGRRALLGLIGSTEQTSQVIGYLTGASIAVAIGIAPALLLDAATFLVAAGVFSVMQFPPARAREGRPPVLAGLREIWRNPVLRLLAVVVWVTVTVTAIPEALATGVTAGSEHWLPYVLASAPAGQAVAFAILGRQRQVERPSFQFVHLAWLALAFGIAALGRSPLWFLVGNFLVGSGIAWLLGPQALFVRVAPPERMAQITGTMIAIIIAAEGVGTLMFGAVADLVSIATAYRAAGFLVLVTAVIGWIVKERIPEAASLDRDVFKTT